MHSYLIEYIKNRIKVSQYVDNHLDTIKFLGETEQNYDESKFWIWFKKKIEYEDEKLSFLVITDNKEFKIPQDSKIVISEVNNINQNQYIRDISKGYFILSFPKRDESISKNASDTLKTEEKVIKESNNKFNSLVSAFRKQTQGYRDDKR